MNCGTLLFCGLKTCLVLLVVPFLSAICAISHCACHTPVTLSRAYHNWDLTILKISLLTLCLCDAFGTPLGRTHDLIKSHYGSLDVFLARHQADIFCVQETCVNRQMFSNLAESKSLGAITESYESFWAFNELKGTLGGMNGVAVWVKKDLAKGANATQKVLEARGARSKHVLLQQLVTKASFC